MYFVVKQKKKTCWWECVITQSNELQSFVTQTIPGWPEYLMTKSQNENTLSPFKLAKINDSTKSRIVNVNIQNNNYVLLETNN